MLRNCHLQKALLDFRRDKNDEKEMHVYLLILEPSARVVRAYERVGLGKFICADDKVMSIANKDIGYFNSIDLVSEN